MSMKTLVAIAWVWVCILSIAMLPTSFKLALVLDFDQTDSEPYVQGTHDCRAFSRELAERLSRWGFQTQLVVLWFDTSKNPDIAGHMIIRVWTIDQHWVYVEPQLDLVFSSLQSAIQHYSCLYNTTVTQVQILNNTGGWQTVFLLKPPQ